MIFTEFDIYDADYKRKYISRLDAQPLLNAFLRYHDNFNPVDDNMCETYNLLREEIIKRCGGKEIA